MRLTNREAEMVSGRERDLVFSIATDQVSLISVFQIRAVCSIGRDLDYLIILSWIKAKGIVGQNFKEWFASFDNSALNAVAEVRKHIKKENFRRSIIAVR